MKHSLRTRLILSFLAVIVATAGLVGVLANRITADRFNYLVSHAGQLQAQRLAPLLADYYIQTGSWNGVEALIEGGLSVRGNPSGRGRYGNGMPMMQMMHMVGGGDDHLILADATGRIVADSMGQEIGGSIPQADLGKGAPIVIQGERVGTLIVASGLGTLTPNQSAFLRQVNGLMAVAAVVAGLAVLLVGWFQARRIVAPVRALAEAARRVAHGDLAQRVPVASQDELGEMATAFNTMAAELEQQHALRRRAMADVAHELRTPLSVLQVDLESIEDGLTAPTPDVIAGLREEVTLLNRLVEDLRMLSLAEAGELQLEVQPVDLRELIQSTAKRVRGAAREKGVELAVELPEDLPAVPGDRQRLAQVLLNLLSNALRHTPAAGQISITARQMGEEEVEVAVRDTGEGIAAGALPYVFERFYRTDQVRGRDTGGSGLGLTIARSLIEAHGGRIWAESEEGMGSTFAFALPVAVESRRLLYDHLSTRSQL
jgi:signal transduction histidine kinase